MCVRLGAQKHAIDVWPSELEFCWRILGTSSSSSQFVEHVASICTSPTEKHEAEKSAKHISTCVYIYIYIYAYVYIYIMCVYLYMYVCMYVYLPTERQTFPWFRAWSRPENDWHLQTRAAILPSVGPQWLMFSESSVICIIHIIMYVYIYIIYCILYIYIYIYIYLFIFTHMFINIYIIVCL